MALRRVYFSPSGEPMNKARWVEGGYDKLSDRNWILTEFEDHKINLIAFLHKWIDVDNGMPEQYFKPYRVSVENILREDIEGNKFILPKYIPDADANKTFYTADEASEYCRNFLAQYTESFIDTNGELVEVGNKKSPDVPKVEEGSPSAEVFGSW